MVFDLIPLIILFSGLAVIGLIVWRRWPYIAHLQVEQIPEHQHAETKRTILENRLKRRLKEVTNNLFSKYLSSHYQRSHGTMKKYWQELVRREEAWRFKIFRHSHPTAQAEQLDNGLKEVERLMQESNWLEAEKKILVLIRLSPQQVPYYRLLSQIYEQQKNWRDAAEALQYVIDKDGQAVEEDYLYLGELYRQAGDHPRALTFFKKAYELDPRDPKNLDFLCEESILQNNLRLAEEALAVLREVNPENQKIPIFKERLKELKK